LKNKNTGNFILIDELSKNTVAAGIILDKGKIPPKKSEKEIKTVNKSAAVLWFTGLSGSGKSAIADEVYKILYNRNIDSERLDGDIFRKKMNRDLGFSPSDRNINIERASYIANILSCHGVMVLATFISPYKKSRQIARRNIKNFIEIFVDAPLSVCESRDAKGLYKKARKNKLKFFTGISDKYETPNQPNIHLKTDRLTVKKCANKIIDYLDKKGLLK